MNRCITLALLAASLCVVACEEQKPAAPATGKESTTAAAQIKDEDISTPSDFDQEAAKDITTDNYKSEVDSLEKEIGE
jgi:hypothetical protein